MLGSRKEIVTLGSYTAELANEIAVILLWDWKTMQGCGWKKKLGWVVCLNSTSIPYLHPLIHQVLRRF